MLINQRIKLTKNMIYDSLTQLLMDHNISEVHVNELCQKAEINRSTFYAHYETIFDVLNEMEDDFISNVYFLDNDKTEQQKREGLMEYIKYIYRNKERFIILLRNGKIDEKVSIQSYQRYVDNHPDVTEYEKNKYKLKISFASAGTYHLILNWLENDSIYNISEITDLLYRLCIDIKDD